MSEPAILSETPEQREARLKWMDGVTARAVAARLEHRGAENAGVQSPAEKTWAAGFLVGHMVCQEETVWPLLASHDTLTALLAEARRERDFEAALRVAEHTKHHDLLRRTAEALNSVMTMHPCGMEHIPDRECCCIRPAMVSETAVLAELRTAGVLS